MSRRRTLTIALTLAAIVVAGSGVSARAGMTDKVDPAKRARLPSGEVIEPAATVQSSSAFSHPRIIRLDRVTVQTATVQDKRAAVQVDEARAETIIRTPVRSPEIHMAGGTNLQPGELPASVPRLDQRRFQEMLGDYEAGRRPADVPLDVVVEVGGRQVDIGAINRFANPRRALEQQGIPVVQAGGGEDASASPESSTDASKSGPSTATAPAQ